MSRHNERILKAVSVGWAVLSVVVSCATTGSRTDSRPAIAIRRGSAWATYSFAPPKIVGPNAALQLEAGVLRGFMDGRPVDIKINQSEATGFGRSGPVNVQVSVQDGQAEVSGLWNGGPLRFLLSPSSVHGSVIIAQGRSSASELSCGYQLDRQEAGGALVGTSTCHGMPQQTRLEVDPAVRRLLSPTELAVFLVAAFAAPPFAPHEGI